MTRRNRILTRVACTLGLALTLLGIAATSVLATNPELGVELERDAATVSHSDERVGYMVKVKNVASAGAPTVAGDTLTCVPNIWFSFAGPLTFTYQWLRSGEPIGGATASIYTTTVADEGEVIQCRVSAFNTTPDATSSTDFAGRTVVTKALVVEPQPATAPPTPPSLILPAPTVEGGGTLDGAESKELKCNAGSWGGSPTAYTYRWYRNALPYGSPTGPTAATSANLTVPVGDQAPPATFQCTVTATNASGSITKESETATTAPSPSPSAPNNLGGSVAPFIATADYTHGPVTVQLELPGGEETFAYKASGEGWSCDETPASGAQHARATCVSAREVAPAGSFPELIVTAALGADAPDLAIAKATAFGGGAPAPASDTNEFTFDPLKEFGLVNFEASLCGPPPSLPSAGLCFDQLEANDYTLAGGHPFAGLGDFNFATKRALTSEGGSTPAEKEFIPVEHVKQVITDLPPGQVGNALAVPELCSGAADILINACPPKSAVGFIHVRTWGGGAGDFAIYAIKPEFGAPAQFAFEEVFTNVFTLTARLRPADGYAISLVTAPAAKVDILSAAATICDFGVDLSGGVVGATCKESDEPGANPKPLFTNPTRCGKPAPVIKARLRSWEHPDAEKIFSFTNAEVTGCDQVDFEPQINLQPTSHQADSATGLDVNLSMPTNGLEGKDDEGNRDPEAVAQANLKKAKITFPEGMAVNPTAGQGLGACSANQVKLETNKPIECPDSSKIGSVEIETPVLEETLKGDVYIAKQGDVDGALIGFYLVFDSKKDGILVKIPARVDPQPNGQLVVTVDDSPEQPFSTVRMHFPGGPRATLLTPPRCGTYEIKSELTPWSGQAPVTGTSSFEVTEGPNGGPCPNGGFDPKLSAGTENPVAGKTSPFLLRLTREDGTQRFSALNLTTPPGLTAYLKGIPYCPDAILAAISEEAGTGQAQIDNPSCPAASQIGTVIAGAGAGIDPLFVDTGKAYLAGPYKGAPLSIAVVTPAVAGPLDLGTVVVRNALYLNPETAQVSVKSDPIPTILHGLFLDIRDIRIAIDRPNFILNPTDCEPLSVGANVKGDSGASASLSNRFQVGGCDKLSFKPKLGIRLFGATHRGAHPSLKGTLEAAPGEANIGRAAVTIPRSEFLDQAHIRTICTRVQFAANACPAGSIYGYASAITPLLDYPVEGPVYLRSSSNKLPDLVVDLHGPAWQPIEAVVVGRIDSIKGQIRTTFENAPDVPLTKFTLSMQGGKKGLLVNSRDICAQANRATVKLGGHNGMESESRPAVRNGKCKQGRKPKRRR